ncbi:xanthine dehydrogenase [Anaeramoeba flamelloides]|uniref:Xanthine dehydrogenase n=1 Tax=Anaeramoeba flamelloides TaxID=1746091 RepID=A0ABQ8ZAU3_9EUKA|nr:xanthine dehydrogenase [Anaeramoeba flamelloides]
MLSIFNNSKGSLKFGTYLPQFQRTFSHVTNFKTNQEFYLNGKKIVLKSGEFDTRKTLLDYLRENEITSVKLGCGEGGCGACTVMMSYYDHEGKIEHKAVDSCLVPLCSIDHSVITTVEGLGSLDNLHPVQERFSKLHATQCGMCTPGFIMTLQSNLEMLHSEDPNSITMHELGKSFDGNICRCGANRPILDVAYSFAKDCPTTLPRNVFKEFKPKDHLIQLPSFLKDPVSPLKLESKGHTWYRPISLESLLELKKENPKAMLIAGNTEVGVEVRFKHLKFPVSISTSHVSELHVFKESEHGITIGGSYPLNKLIRKFQKLMKKEKKKTKYSKYEGIKQFVSILEVFASNQIRNTACLAGNMVTASPLAESPPVLLALDSLVTIVDTNQNRRTIPASKFFIPKYRSVNLDTEKEVIESIFIPYTQEREFVQAYKQSRRKEEDICIANGAFRVKLDQNNVVKDVTMAFNGVAPYVKMAHKTMDLMMGRPFNQDLVSRVLKSLEKEVNIPKGSPGGMGEYRTVLVQSFFYKFALHVLNKINPSALNKRSIGAHKAIKRSKVLKSTQEFDRDELTKENKIPMGSSELQVTGKALFVDDIPKPMGTLHAAPVTTSIPSGRILDINAEEALKLEGVVDFISYKDLPKNGKKMIGVIQQDEPVFAYDEVQAVGQLIGLVIAKNPIIAREAVKKVLVKYEETESSLNIEQSIKNNTFYKEQHRIDVGDVEEAFKNCEHVISKEINVGSQEHFYIETQATLAIPKEGNEMLILASTQNPSHTQEEVSHVLGVKLNKVVVTSKRLGGGFGGKENQSVILSCVTAVAAKKLKKPISLSLDREEDFEICGRRHPFKATFKVGFNSDGKIKALKTDLYALCGWSLDLSGSIMDRALFHSTGSYLIPNASIVGHLCKTNTNSNTAFRGFGAPQGMMATECAMELIARTLKKSPEYIREINLIKEGEKTIFGQPVDNNNLSKVWDTIKQSDKKLDELKQEVEEFNKEHKFRKRGVALLPMLFGISFTAKLLNQAGALIQVYKDGTVLASHGGTEMGQGLYTKLSLVVARELDIPIENVFINETSTDKVPNTSPTAASSGCDLNGGALKDACDKLNKRLNPLRKKHPNKSWKEIVQMAYVNRIDLSAHGFYSTPNLSDYFREGSSKEIGYPFAYFTFGASLSLVEIDTLTGDHVLLRSDVVSDVGDSIHPEIDIGQVEGAFTQGYGYLTLEELVRGDNTLENSWIKKGHLQTKGPGYYKVPLPLDLPQEFNVKLLKNAKKNPNAIHSSRAVGEPPFVMGNSVYFALKNAIYAARQEFGNDEYFQLNAPVTCEKIRMMSLTKLDKL